MSKKKIITENRVTTRKHRCTFMLNNHEQKALDRYLKKYNIKNKSKLFREVLMVEVISRLEKDSPTLFDHND